MPDTTIPRAKVEELARLVQEQHILFDKQRLTQAEMIRGCIQRIRWAQDPDGSPAVRRAEGFTKASEARRKVREEGAQALLYLEALATSLENQASGNLTAPTDAA